MFRSGALVIHHTDNQDDLDVCASEGFASDLIAHYQIAYKKLTYIAAGVLGKSEGAEDIVQQAVSIAIDKDERFQSGDHFVGWLCSTVRLCAMNQRRKTSGRKTTPADPAILSMMLDNKNDQDAHPVQPKTGMLLDNQRAFDDQVLSALQSLQPESRSCLLLKVIEDLSYKEIAKLMDIPEGTAMSHVHRGKAKLRQVLTSDRQLKGDNE